MLHVDMDMGIKKSGVFRVLGGCGRLRTSVASACLSPCTKRGFAATSGFEYQPTSCAEVMGSEYFSVGTFCAPSNPETTAFTSGSSPISTGSSPTEYPTFSVTDAMRMPKPLFIEMEAQGLQVYVVLMLRFKILLSFSTCSLQMVLRAISDRSFAAQFIAACAWAVAARCGAQKQPS